MSDSEPENPSTASESSREGETSTSRGKHRARKKRKVMSSSSEVEEEEKEEKEEKKQQFGSSQGASSEFSVEEEGEGTAALIQEETPCDSIAVIEDSSSSSPEGDDDGDSVDSDSSSEVPGAETCAICLGRMRGEVGSPESCEHTFCLICILEWAKTNASCPQDRKPFSKVSVRMTLGAEVVEREVVIKQQESDVVQFPEADNPTYCEVCHECDREERLLLCDGCDLGYHLECLDPPLVQVPVEEWFCPGCVNANIPSTVGVQRAPQEGESSASQRQPRRQQSSSQRPRLIPRTRATERVRDRIIRKRREKRKKLRLNRKRRIESGEIDDPRPAVDCKERLLFFGSLGTDIPSQDTDDKFADQLLASGSGWSSGRNQVVRKADAARVLRDSAYTPLSSYIGRASPAVMNRVNIQAEESREDDVLSSILENQSIVLTNSKKLSLTSDRKLKKEGEGSDAESFRLEQEENPLMSEPLPSRRPQKMDGEDERQPSSLPKGPHHSRFFHHPSSSQNSEYGHPSRRYEPSPKTLKEERAHREERIQREERPSVVVHQSPLEDRRRSPPRLSYQRHVPPHQFRSQRNFRPEHRNRDPHIHRDERQRYQRSPPWRGTGHRQNPSSDSRWEHRHSESSGNSSREPSSQERNGRNGKDSSKDKFDFRSHKPQSDKRGSSPASNMHDKYSRRNEDSERYPRWEEDRHRKEDRGYHRYHHHRDHSDHRSYRSSYRTERDSPTPHSSQQVRSYSRSPVRSRSPLRSKSRSRSREVYSRGHESLERRRKAHKLSNNNDSAHTVSLSPQWPEGTLSDSQHHQGSQRGTSEHDSSSDARPSSHTSKFQEPSSESLTSESSLKKGRPVEAKSSSFKAEMDEDKIACHEGSSKASRGDKKERDVIKDVNDTHCDSNVADQRCVSKEMSIRKADTSGKYDGNKRIADNEVTDSGVETADNLLYDARRGDVKVQSSSKGDQKKEKFHKDIKTTDSKKIGNGCDTQSLQRADCSEDMNRKQHQNENESTAIEDNLERRKRKGLIPEILGRVLEYTPEEELSHWDDKVSPADFPSPFKIIKKADACESDQPITLPFSLQRLLPGDKIAPEETEDRKKTPREGKLKPKVDSNTREEEGRSSSHDKIHRLKNTGHDTERSGKTGKEEESMSGDKFHTKNTESHKTPKVNAKLHNSKSKNVISSSSVHATISGCKIQEKSAEDVSTKESHTLIPQRRENLTHPDTQEATQATSQLSSLVTKATQEYIEKKDSAEKMRSYCSVFGDISDISDGNSDDGGGGCGGERSKKLVTGSCAVERTPEKQNDAQNKDKQVHGKTKDIIRKSDDGKKIGKCDASLNRSLKLESSVPSSITSLPHKDAKSKSQGKTKTTKDAGSNKDFVLDLFGNTSDSNDDESESAEVKPKEPSIQKTSEKPHKSSPLKGDSGHRRTRESAESHKRKDRKCEKGIALHKKASEKPPKAVSSEEPETDSVHKNAKEIPDSHKEKDRQYKKETSPHKKSSEDLSKSTSESLRGNSDHKKMREMVGSHKEKDKMSDKETLPCKNSSQETPKVEPDPERIRETTLNHKKLKDRDSQETQKKASEKSLKEHHDSHLDHRKAKKATDIYRGQAQKDKKLAQPPTEDYGKSKSGYPDDKGGTFNSKERKFGTEEMKLREKDTVSKTESKQSVATPASLHSTSHTSERREKKDAVDTYAKQLKASLEVKVVAEVKKCLDPHYRDKSITKDEYKEIVAKCVSKVVSAECGDVIESEKMRCLVEGYVKLYRHRRAKQQPLNSS